MKKEILKTYNGIQSGLKQNSRTTHLSILLCCITIICSAFLCYTFWNDSLNNFLIVDNNGRSFKLLLANKNEESKLTINANMRYFYNALYTFNQHNYKRKKEKAVWLGDESIQTVINEFEGGFYNDVVENNAIVDSYITDIQIEGEKEPFLVKTKGIMTLRIGTKLREYELNGACEVISVGADEQKNPFGWFIKKWEDHRAHIRDIKQIDYDKENDLKNGED